MTSSWHRYLNAIEFVRSCQNTDGGVGATNRGEPSGCWTTSMALQAFSEASICSEPNLRFVFSCTRFLVANQLQDGSWPVVVGGEGSTMSTAQSVGALYAVVDIIKLVDVALGDKAAEAYERGARWLLSNQHHSGGWSVEPTNASGGQERVIATIYALGAILSIPMTAERDSAKARSVNWFKNIQAASGGFPDLQGGAVTLASTARCVALMKKIDDPVAKATASKALSFLLRNKKKWLVATERYVSATAPGQTRFHANILCDISNALASDPVANKIILFEILERAAHVQSNEGSWPLFDMNTQDNSISTWSTAEWISLMSRLRSVDPLYISGYSASELDKNRQKIVGNYLYIVSGTVIFVIISYNVVNVIYDWFSSVSPNLPGAVRLAASLIGAVLTAVIGTFAARWILALLGKRRADGERDG